MKLLKFTLISILGLSLCTACGGDGDGGETPGPGKPEGPDKSSTTGIDRFDASNIFSRNTYLPDNTAMQGFNLDSDGSVWYTQLSNTNQAQLNWVRAQPNKTPDVQTENKDYMKLTYFGHGTNNRPRRGRRPTVTCGPEPTASATPKASTGTKSWWGASNT